MNNTTTVARFAGFDYEAAELSAYIFSIDTFIISLKDDSVIHFVAEVPDDFRQWLDNHRIRNINDEIGDMVYNYYFPKEGKGKE